MKIEKIVGIAIAVVLGFILVLNLFTVVGAGTTKVASTFGTVNQTPLTEGLHFPVNPFASFDVMDTRNNKYEVEALSIPTQDRFNSTGNVTILYRIDWKKTPYIKQNYGTVNEYISKTLRQYLRSIIRDEGRKIADSRGLAVSANIVTMQFNLKNRLVEAMADTGITIQQALIQDIEFDPRIAKQILDTQKRIQAEESKKSEERIATTDAKIAKQKAIGAAHTVTEKATADAFRINAISTAEKDAVIAVATGEAEGIKLIAKANRELTGSLTEAILEKQRLDNEAILYSKSVGNVPSTIIGDTDLRAIGVPFAISN